MKKKLALILIAVILIISSSLILLKAKGISSNKELVKRVIEIAVVSGEIPDYGLIKDNENIIVCHGMVIRTVKYQDKIAHGEIIEYVI